MKRFPTGFPVLVEDWIDMMTYCSGRWRETAASNRALAVVMNSRGVAAGQSKDGPARGAQKLSGNVAASVATALPP